MPRRATRFLVATGSALAAIGLTGAAVFQLQPWRTCPDDTSPAACPVLRADHSTFLVFVLLLLAGCLVLLAAGVARLKQAPPPEQ